MGDAALIEVGVARIPHPSPTFKDKVRTKAKSGHASYQVYPGAEVYKKPEKHRYGNEKSTRLPDPALGERLAVVPAISVDVGNADAETLTAALFFKPFILAANQLRKKLLGKVLAFHHLGVAG